MTYEYMKKIGLDVENTFFGVVRAIEVDVSMSLTFYCCHSFYTTLYRVSEPQ